MQAWGTPPSYSRSPTRQTPISEPYQSCSCESHRQRHEEINKLISKQYDFNCIITEETENIERQLLQKKEKVLLTEVSLNEKREEIAKLTAEIEHINPDILNLTDQELHDINLKMAEDVKILAEKISNSPSGDNGRKEHIDRRESDDMPIQMSQSFTEGSNFSFNGPFTSMDKQRTSPSPSLGSKSSSRSWIKKKIPKI